jgi:cystathionine beta-lyase
MVTYDFDTVISRKNTNCAKWDAAEFLFGEKDIIPMWVADMDLPIARPITEALRKRTAHEFYGYSLPVPFSTASAVITRMKQKYNWDVKPEWIVTTPGVVPALFTAVRAFTIPGDAVILQDPVYYPFWGAIENNGCHVTNNQLKLVDGHYEIDFDNLGARFEPVVRMLPSPSRIRMMILCHPHNPVGRVWTRQELIEMGEIVIGNKAIVVSDEIHCELLFKGHQHIPFASISKEFEQNSVTCIAASKTFNLAGLETSILIIPNADLKQKFEQTRKGFLPNGNVFGMVALEAAFNEGDEWLEQFLNYMQENMEFLIDYFERHIPKIRVIKPEGTYLVWLDCRQLAMTPKALETFMNTKAKVGLDHGVSFGRGGQGFERINIACPRSVLAEALKRIELAVNALE